MAANHSHTLTLGAAGTLDVAPAASGGAAQVLLRTAGGTPSLLLHVSAGEVCIECLGGALRLRTTGTLQLQAQSLALHSVGELSLQSDTRIAATAPHIAIEATRGDACVTANDDVRIEGERIRMNA